MGDGVEVLVTYRRQDHQSDPLERAEVPWRMVGPAINRHLVASFHQPEAELLRERFEAAVVGGDPSGAENGYGKGHIRGSARNALSPSESRVYPWSMLRSLSVPSITATWLFPVRQGRNPTDLKLYIIT